MTTLTRLTLYLTKPLARRLDKWGAVRGLEAYEAAALLIRDRLDDIDQRAQAGRKMVDQMTDAQRSAKGRKAVAIRWAKVYAAHGATPKKGARHATQGRK